MIGDRYDGDSRPDRDALAVLGQAISEWGEVEFWLLIILRRLAGIEHNESLAIFSNIRNFRSISDMLKDISEEKMASSDVTRFHKLLDKFNSLASKRNLIVHSSWYKHKDVWSRYLVPSGKIKIDLVLCSHPKGQKIRRKHLITKDGILEFCSESKVLQDNIMEFWDDWDHRRNPS
jgi:hypothetical protein